MSLYSEIAQFNHLFHGIRIHDTYIIIDLKLPASWEDKKILSSRGDKVQMKVNNTTDKMKLVSFFTTFDEENVTILVQELNSIVKWNKDLEEKNNLLNHKMVELKKVFQENNIDSLRELNIGFNNNILNEGNTLDAMVGESFEKGQTGNSNS